MELILQREITIAIIAWRKDSEICKRWFQTVVRVWSEEQIPRPHLTSVLPLFYLFFPCVFTFFCPLFLPLLLYLPFKPLFFAS